ncbi:MAG: acyltransferase family protein [Pseudoxanthomonas sp.]
MGTKVFRDDINGLRAWAVVAVILFHFGVPGFSGGFVGVDVFFVISGFLMTGIIVKHLRTIGQDAPPFASFLLEFWLARARRIIPALLALCATLLTLGWLRLPPQDYQILATHVIAALLFVSNIKFWKEAGYFDTASHEKWLLHTWSLSVEWQFYLLLPLALMLVWRFVPRQRPLAWLVMLGTAASFALCVVGTQFKPDASFYLLPTRAWEMLAGGLVFLFAEKTRFAAGARRGLEAAGFALIVASIVLLDGQDAWPGWRAALPVVGAVLVLTAARSGTPFTGTWLAQRIGDCSYSLYLWHWPVSVLLVCLDRHGEPRATSIGLAATAALGWASYRLVETPSRKSLGKLKLMPAIAAFAAMLGLVGAASAVVRLDQGVQGRLPADVERLAAEAGDRNPRRDECIGAGSRPPKECTYGGPQLGIIVLGDSHAAAVVRSVEKSLPGKEYHVLDWTADSCATIAGLKDAKPAGDSACGQFVHDAEKRLEDESPRVPLLVVNRMNTVFEAAPDAGFFKPRKYLDVLPDAFDDRFRRQMRDAAVDTLCRLAEHRPVYVLRETPEMPQSVPEAMSHAAMFQGAAKRVKIPAGAYRERSRWAYAVQDIAAARCGVKILDPTPYLCDDKFCYGDKDGVPVFYDDDHLSERGAQLLIPLFKQMFVGSNAEVAAK